MAGGQLNIYNLGELGVVIDKSPVHTRDGELLRAQNAQSDSVGTMGGIRKRDGIAKVNAAAMAGRVTGMIGLPLPDEAAKTPTIYIALEDVTNAFRTFDSNGSTGVTAGTTKPAGAKPGVGTYNIEMALAWKNGSLVWVSHQNKLWYPGNDYTVGTDKPTIHSFDGTTDVLVAKIPNNSDGTAACAVTSIIAIDAYHLLVAVAQTNNTGTQFYFLDTRNGSLQTTGAGTVAEVVYNGLALWGGRIWAIGRNGGGGSALPYHSATLGYDDLGSPKCSSWVSDTWMTTGGFTASGYCTGIVSFLGTLYTGHGADNHVSGRTAKLSAAGGSWSFPYYGRTTSGTAGSGSYVGPFAVSADGTKLFAFEYWAEASPVIRIMESTDGATFVDSFDIYNNGALGSTYTCSGQPYTDPDTGHIYWTLASGSGLNAGAVLKRDGSSGVWTILGSGASYSNLRGPIGSIRSL